MVGLTKYQFVIFLQAKNADKGAMIPKNGHEFCAQDTLENILQEAVPFVCLIYSMEMHVYRRADETVSVTLAELKLLLAGRDNVIETDLVAIIWSDWPKKASLTQVGYRQFPQLLGVSLPKIYGEKSEFGPNSRFKYMLRDEQYREINRTIEKTASRLINFGVLHNKPRPPSNYLGQS